MYKIYANAKVVFINHCLHMVLVVQFFDLHQFNGSALTIDRVRLRMHVPVVLVPEPNLFFSSVIIEV